MGQAKLEGLSGHGGYAFGPFVVDPVKRRLWRDGRLVPITVEDLRRAPRAARAPRPHRQQRRAPEPRVAGHRREREQPGAADIVSAAGARPTSRSSTISSSLFPVTDIDSSPRVQDLPDVPPELQRSRRPLAVPPEPAMELQDTRAGDRVRWPSGRFPESTQTTPIRAHRPQRRGDGRLRGSRRRELRTPGDGRGRGAAASCGSHSQPRRTLQRITYDEAALPRDAAWAPDGQWVVYASDRSGNADLWKQRLGDPDPVRLTTSEANESQPQWSPDGRSIVFRSERDGGGLYVIPASGGVERMVSSFGYEPRWSPDGTLILFKRSVVLPDLPTIYVVGLDGKPPRPVRPDVLGQFSSLHAAWHPDGRRISIWGTTRQGEVTFLTVPLDGGSATTPRDVGAGPAGPRERLRGEVRLGAIASVHLFRGAGGRYPERLARDRRSVDRELGRWPRTPDHRCGRRNERGASRRTARGWSSRRRRAERGSGRFRSTPPAGASPASRIPLPAAAPEKWISTRAPTARRSRIAPSGPAATSCGNDRLPKDGSGCCCRARTGEWSKPRWSPDGAKLAFSRCATRDNSLAVAVFNTDGSGERVLTKPGQVEMQGSDWSKDGRAILGACRFSQSERYATCLVPSRARTRPAIRLVRVIASDPKRNLFNQRFSPDQRWITFLAHDLSYASTSTVYVTPAAGGAWRAITDGAWFDDKPRWGPDGRILYFVSNRTGVANVWGRRFDDSTGTPIGEPFPVTSFRSAQFQLTPRTVQMDIAVTTTDLLLPMSESRSDIWMLDQVDR